MFPDEMSFCSYKRGGGYSVKHFAENIEQIMQELNDMQSCVNVSKADSIGLFSRNPH